MAADLLIQPKLLIPEEWANRARCPVCCSVYLSLKRSYSDPDQLACDSCKARFEISIDGNFVRVMVPPPGLPMDLIGQWVKPESMAAQGKEMVMEAKVSAEAEQTRRSLPVKAVSQEALCEQARQLLQLGNTPENVRGTLTGMRGVTAEQVGEAMAAQPAQNGGRSKLFLAGLAVISMLVITIAVVIGMGLAQRGTEAKTGNELPASVRVLLFSGSALLDFPAVEVYRVETTGNVSSCPTQPANAARMFGGDASAWSGSEAGWSITTRQPQTVRLPEGMKAQYLLVAKDARMVAVSGPARLENVVYMDIACQR